MYRTLVFLLCHFCQCDRKRYVDPWRYNDIESNAIDIDTEPSIAPDFINANTSVPEFDPSNGIILNRYHPDESINASMIREKFTSSPDHAGFIPVLRNLVSYYYYFWFYKSKVVNGASQPLLIWLAPTPHIPVLMNLGGNNSKYNILLLDDRTFEGYSFTDPYVSDTKVTDVAHNLHQAIIEFLSTFYVYRKNHVYLIGSYTRGKIIPYIMTQMETHHYDKPLYVNLKGAVLMESIVDLDYIVKYINIKLQLGFTDIWTTNKYHLEEPFIRAILKSERYKELLIFIARLVESIGQAEPILNIANNQTITLYGLFNDTNFKKRINVGNRSYYGLETNVNLPATSDIGDFLPKLINMYKILYVNGQLETFPTYVMISEFLDKLDWQFSEVWYNTPRIVWKKNNTVIGYWKRYLNLHHFLKQNGRNGWEAHDGEIFFEMLDEFINHRWSLV